MRFCRQPCAGLKITSTPVFCTCARYKYFCYIRVFFNSVSQCVENRAGRPDRDAIHLDVAQKRCYAKNVKPIIQTTFGNAKLRFNEAVPRSRHVVTTVGSTDVHLGTKHISSN